MLTKWAFSWSFLYFNRSATRDEAGASADCGCLFRFVQNAMMMCAPIRGSRDEGGIRILANSKFEVSLIGQI